MSDPKYVRVYYSVVDDDRFVGIYDDDRAFSAWMRLLLLADSMWPATAPLPRNVKAVALTKLVDAGIVELCPGSTFRLHGLDAERQRRSASGRNAAAMRWHSARNAAPMPRRDETRQDETSVAPAPARDEVDDGRLDLEAWLLVKRRIPTPRQRDFLDAYCRTFDVTGPARAERIILTSPDDPIAALKADLDAFRAERVAAAKAAEVKPPQPSRGKGGLTGINKELAEMFREQYDGEGRS